MIQITDREDFKDRFAALMAADISLIHAGIDPKSELIPDMIDAFLDQYEATTPKPASAVPLPPASIFGKKPLAYIARNKTTGGTSPGTASGSFFQTEIDLNNLVSPAQRHGCEIVPLFAND